MAAPEASVPVAELRRDPDGALRRAAGAGGLVWVRAGRQRLLLVSGPDAVRETLVERARELVKPRSQAIALGRPKPEPVETRVSTPRLRRALARGMGADRAAAAAAALADGVRAGTSTWRDGEMVRPMPWLRPLVIRAVVSGPFASRLSDEEVERLAAVVRAVDRAPRVERRGPTLWGLTRPLRVARLSLVVRSLLENADLSRPSELGAVTLEHDEFAPALGAAERQALLGELLLGAVGPLVQTGGWALFRFATEAAASRLRAEWDAGEGRAFTEAFVREVTRLHPTNPHITRAAVVDTSVGGEPVPADTRAIVDVSTLQRDPRVYEQPERFLPERWLEGRAPEHRFSYAAFGIGDRRCLGEAIATRTVAALVEAVGREWDLSFADVDVSGRGRRQLADNASATVVRHSP